MNRRSLFFGAPALALPGFAQAQQRGTRVTHHRSLPLAKPPREIRMNNGKPDYLYTTLYLLKLPSLRIGDVVQAHAQFEATNDSPFVEAMFAHAMLLHRRPTIYDHEARKPRDEVVCDYSGENISRQMHHGFRTLAGSFRVEQPGDAWVSVLIYAAHIHADPARHVLRIEGNWPGENPYGDLRAVVFRNS